MSHPIELVAPFRLAYTFTRSTGPIYGRWLTALRDGRLEGVRTADGRVLFPPAEADPLTGEAVTDAWVPVGPEGEVVTWTWVAAPGPKDPSQAPFAWALVRLDGAANAVLAPLRADRERVSTGMRVRAVLAEARAGTLHDLHGFVPAEDP